MLRQAIQAATPELKSMVEDLLYEEVRFMQKERRGLGRQPLARPVTLEFFSSDRPDLVGISKDISGEGVGIITTEPVDIRTQARLQIHRYSGRPSVVIAECRWCDESIGNWFFSGWNFANLEFA